MVNDALSNGVNPVTDLAARLRELRHPLTQAALGSHLGVSPALISSWESGILPPVHRLRQYAAELAGHGEDLEAELLQLRRDAGGRPDDELVQPRAARSRHHARERAASTEELLQDIRYLLSQILQRMPPPS